MMWDDRAIVDLYWDRDQQAIVRSQEKYGSQCQRMAQNILSSYEDAEECVNDTWVKAWNTMPQNRPNHLGAYLGRIVRNLALDRWRKLRAQKRGAGLDTMLAELDECIPANETTEQQVEARELTRLIERWLEQLSQEERVLFVRRYWYGEPAEKDAKRLWRLRKKLKAYLEQEELYYEGKSLRLFEAITELDERFIQEVPKDRPKWNWRPWAGAAAALVLAVGLGWPVFIGFFAMGGGNTSAPATPSAPAGGSTPASSESSIDMPATFPSGGISIALEDGAPIEIDILDRQTIALTNPTQEDWTGAVYINDRILEQTVPAGETVILDLEDLP